AQIDRDGLQTISAALDARECQQLSDHFIKTLALAFDAIQRAGCIRTGAPAREPKRDSLSRQRRAQLMRNVSEQPALRFDQRFNSARHEIEVATEQTDLIAPLQQPFIHARLESAVSQFARGASQLG